MTRRGAAPLTVLVIVLLAAPTLCYAQEADLLTDALRQIKAADREFLDVYRVEGTSIRMLDPSQHEQGQRFDHLIGTALGQRTVATLLLEDQDGPVWVDPAKNAGYLEHYFEDKDKLYFIWPLRIYTDRTELDRRTKEVMRTASVSPSNEVSVTDESEVLYATYRPTRDPSLWYYKPMLYAGGRALWSKITRLESIEERDGLLHIAARGRYHGSGSGDDYWQIVADQKLGFLIRRAAFSRSKNGPATFEVRNTGTVTSEGGDRSLGEECIVIYRFRDGRERKRQEYLLSDVSAGFDHKLATLVSAELSSRDEPTRIETYARGKQTTYESWIDGIKVAPKGASAENEGTGKRPEEDRPQGGDRPKGKSR